MLSTWEILVDVAGLYEPLWIGRDMRKRHAQIKLDTREFAQCLEQLVNCQMRLSISDLSNMQLPRVMSYYPAYAITLEVPLSNRPARC